MSGAAAPANGEPSMDDILASIRKILNEDDTAAPAAEAGAAGVPAEEEVIDLSPDMMIRPPVEAPAAEPPVAAPPPQEPPIAVGPAVDGLLGAAAAAASAAALSELSRAVAQDRAAALARGGALSLEDVVREELRPLLKAWLDAHLPPLVERLVRQEIERVMARAG